MKSAFTRIVTRGLAVTAVTAAAALAVAAPASADPSSHQIGTMCVHHVKYEVWVDTEAHLVPLHQSC